MRMSILLFYKQLLCTKTLTYNNCAEQNLCSKCLSQMPKISLNNSFKIKIKILRKLFKSDDIIIQELEKLRHQIFVSKHFIFTFG